MSANDPVIPEGVIDEELVITLNCEDGTTIQCALVSIVAGVLLDDKLLAILMQVDSAEEGADLILMEHIGVDDESFELLPLDEANYLRAVEHAKDLIEELNNEPFTVVSGGSDVGEA